MNHKFSVVIPCYNAQDTIEKAIKSVINQTYKNFEIIIVDDCSKDNTIKVVNKFIDTNIKLLRIDVNSGPSKARNIGWDNAKGDYVAFLDSDDIWHKKKLEIINDIINKNDIVFLAHNYSIEEYNFNTFKEETMYLLKRISFWSLLIHNVVATPCTIIKRDITLRFNEKMKYCEDLDLWIRITMLFQLFYFDSKITTLGRPPHSIGGLSNNRIKMRIGEFKMYYNVAKNKKIIFLLFPFLVVLSLLKHILNFFKTNTYFK